MKETYDKNVTVFQYHLKRLFRSMTLFLMSESMWNCDADERDIL